jgi:hypothetical protein
MAKIKKTSSPKPPTATALPLSGFARLIERLDPWFGVFGISITQAVGLIATPIVYWLGVASGFMGPFLAAICLWIALVLIGVAAGPRPSTGNRYWMPRWLRASLCISAVVLITYGGVWLYRNYCATRPRATKAELRGNYISNRTVYLSDLTLDRMHPDSAVSDKTFDNCTLTGPGIIYLNVVNKPCLVDGGTFIAPNLESIFIERDTKREYMGVIAFSGVVFKNTIFDAIGFLATPVTIDYVKKQTAIIPPWFDVEGVNNHNQKTSPSTH